MGKPLVVPNSLLPKLGPSCRRNILRQAITSLGQSFIWVAPLLSGIKDHPTTEQQLKIMERASREWVRMWWDMSLGAFHGSNPLADLGDPKWPDKSFNDLLSEALVGHIVTNEDHPI